MESGRYHDNNHHHHHHHHHHQRGLMEDCRKRRMRSTSRQACKLPPCGTATWSAQRQVSRGACGSRNTRSLDERRQTHCSCVQARDCPSSVATGHSEPNQVMSMGSTTCCMTRAASSTSGFDPHMLNHIFRLLSSSNNRQGSDSPAQCLVRST